jgi:hypothetical protein
VLKSKCDEIGCCSGTKRKKRTMLSGNEEADKLMLRTVQDVLNECVRMSEKEKRARERERNIWMLNSHGQSN